MRAYRIRPFVNPGISEGSGDSGLNSVSTVWSRVEYACDVEVGQAHRVRRFSVIRGGRTHIGSGLQADDRTRDSDISDPDL